MNNIVIKGIEFISYDDGMLYRANPQQAFHDAIESKKLKKPQDYMYMHSCEKNDYFKHIDTRNYLTVRR